MQAQVSVRVMAPILQPSGRYHVSLSKPVEMRPGSVHGPEIVENAEAVLQGAEALIRSVPQQWAMTLPVWPEALREVPAPVQPKGSKPTGR